MPAATSYLNPVALIDRLHLAPGQWVGDFGVGSAAHFALVAAERVGADGGVLMFDVVKPALSGAMTAMEARGLTNCRSVWTNLEIYGGATGVKDKSLDAGVLANVLHQSQHPKEILAEAHRMLKTEAALLVIDWKPEVEATIAPDKNKRLAVGYVAGLATSIGFAPAEQFEAGPYHWGLVLVKT